MPGARCGVAGFAARHDLEHKIVCLLQWHPERQRWRVRVEETNEEICVRSSTLETLVQAQAGRDAAALAFRQQQLLKLEQQQWFEQRQQQQEVAHVMNGLLVQLEASQGSRGSACYG